MVKPNLTQEQLKTLLHYDSNTGIFVWKKTSSRRAVKGTTAGGANALGYIQIGILGKRYSGHRLAWFYIHSVWPNEIDHINKIRIDNRLSNLRVVTSAQNSANCHNRKRRKHSELPRGVTPRNGKFVAQIGINGKIIYLGRFKTPAEAEAAYLNAVKKYHGEFAHNLPYA